jgi:dTDP-4-dehydrorhamnose reductase
VQKNNIYIFGGNSLAASFLPFNNYSIKFQSRSKCKFNKNDIYKISKKNVLKYLSIFKPNLVISLIANTNVNLCEKNKKKSLNDNFIVNKVIIDCCKILKLKFIFFSSDQIFSGGRKSFNEKDKAKPLNNYAKHKLKVENYIKKNLKHYLIIRTNFFCKSNKFSIFNLINKNKKIYGFNDIYFNPLHITNVWKLVFFLINNKHNGTYNLSSNNKISKFTFIKKIVDHLRLKRKIYKINYSDTKLAKTVLRPNNMCISNNKIKKIYKNKKIFMLKNNINIL